MFILHDSNNVSIELIIWLKNKIAKSLAWNCIKHVFSKSVFVQIPIILLNVNYYRKHKIFHLPLHSLQLHIPPNNSFCFRFQILWNRILHSCDRVSWYSFFIIMNASSSSQVPNSQSQYKVKYVFILHDRNYLFYWIHYLINRHFPLTCLESYW